MTEFHEEGDYYMTTNNLMKIRHDIDMPKQDIYRLGIQPAEHGWGVFAQKDGIESPINYKPELRSVHEDEIVAKREADRLNKEEGYVDHEVHADPETAVYSSLQFYVGEVSLSEVTTIIEVRAVYETLA